MVRAIGQTSFEKGVEKGMEHFQLAFENWTEKGMRLVLRRQLAQLFGPLSDTARSRLEAWPMERLLQLGTKLLTFQSLVELGLADADNRTAASF